MTSLPIHFVEGLAESETVGVCCVFTVMVSTELLVEQEVSSDEVTITFTLSPLAREEVVYTFPECTF